MTTFRAELVSKCRHRNNFLLHNVRYIAGVLKTRSNLAAKFKVQLLPLAAVALTASFKFLEGAASWLVACKSNKYEVIVHGQKNSIDLFMGWSGK